MKLMCRCNAALRVVTALLAASFVGACAGSGYGYNPPPVSYELTAPSMKRSGSPQKQLIVAEPTALALLDSDRIIVQSRGGELTTLANAQWNDRLPKLVQSRVIQTFENANWLGAVGRPGDQLTSDYQLLINIRVFQLSAVSDDSARADVELAVKLVAESTGRIIAAKIFRARVGAGESAGAGAIKALDEAFRRVAAELVPWVTQRILAQQTTDDSK